MTKKRPRPVDPQLVQALQTEDTRLANDLVLRSTEQLSLDLPMDWRCFVMAVQVDAPKGEMPFIVQASDMTDRPQELAELLRSMADVLEEAVFQEVH